VTLAFLAIDPLSALVVIVTGPVLVLLLVLIGGRAKELTERRFQEMGWSSAYFLDMLQGLPTLKMFGWSREQVDNIREISRRYGSAALDVLRAAFETAFVLELSATIATALVAVETGLRLAHGSMPFERALAVLLITPDFFLPLRQLSLRYHAGAAGLAAAERIFAILDTPISPAGSPRSDGQNGHRAPVSRSGARRGDIRFDGVWASYEGGGRPALQDVSFLIPDGATTALVGATGAGKSTVASLVLRFTEPDKGAIFAGGVELAAMHREAWLRKVAWVPQQPHLFTGTIADNIRLARPGASDAAVIAAAEDATADAFIRRLPQGYETQIGERGARLSGGERQRLAVARAFLKDAPFFVLDEPSSHLDAESEVLLRDAIERLRHARTVIVIAHRLELVASADQVVVLDQGRVVETGSHDRLLSTCLTYQAVMGAYESGVAA
jgi:ATP-binding cassette subfamily C protein CydD